MTDKPILFSGPMIRSLLAGQKSQTRRVIKLPTQNNGFRIYEHPKMGGWEATTIGGGGTFSISKTGERVPEPERAAIWHRTCGVVIVPPYQVGDRLWVREAWKAHSTFEGVSPRDIPQSTVFYLADNKYAPSGSRGRPGMFMPRWASRLTLTVTDVKVERLDDISEEDAIAEGIERVEYPGIDKAYIGMSGWKDYRDHPHAVVPFIDPKNSYETLWDSINGKKAPWATNPFVVAVTFSVVKQNIDEVAACA